MIDMRAFVAHRVDGITHLDHRQQSEDFCLDLFVFWVFRQFYDPFVVIAWGVLVILRLYYLIDNAKF